MRHVTHEPVDSETWPIIPLYNEAEVIGEVITGLREHFAHVVCVDDGSSDDSIQEARRAGAVVVKHPINLGQGAALQTAIDYVLTKTTGQYIVTFDADGQHQPRDAVDMVARARAEGAAIVFGSRFLDTRTQPGWAKRLVLKTAVWVTNKSTGLRLTDAHNGLRVLRRDAAQSVDLTQNRMAHASEVVSQLGASKLPWLEHPVHILYTDYSKKKGQSLLNSINILWDLVVN